MISKIRELTDQYEKDQDYLKFRSELWKLECSHDWKYPEKHQYPIFQTPVLAEINHKDSLGESKWFEVIYRFEGEWRSYVDSNTFNNGETVVKWKYCD